MSKKRAQNLLIIILVAVYLLTCIAVGYNAIVSAQPQHIVPNIYFERSTPQPQYNKRA